jgi:hypothetical protein
MNRAFQTRTCSAVMWMGAPQPAPLQAALDFKLYLKEDLPKAILGRINLVTSNCVRAELRRCG